METTIENQLSLKRWILLTFGGWFIGVAIIIGLGTISETIGLNLGGNSIVGVGMGAGVGWMQWIALKKQIGFSKNWIWFSIIGFTLSYVAADIVSAIYNLKPEQILIYATSISALICGWLQYQFMLKKISSIAIYWIVFNVIGWCAAHFLTIGLFTLKLDFIPKIIQIILAFVFVVIAAPLLGFITGKSIISILKNPRKSNEEKTYLHVD